MRKSPPLTKITTKGCQNGIIALKYYQNVGAFLSPTAVGTDRRADNLRVCLLRMKKERGFYHEEEITCYADDWRYGCKPCSLRRRFFYPG